jgi:TPP-dependent pyruvate/acetoin dehydrogenase alpha subunit
MVTNEIRRTKIKLELLESDNLNWLLKDVLEDFSDNILNDNIISNEEIKDIYKVIENIKKRIKKKYLEEINKEQKSNQSEFKFYVEN